MMFRSLVLIAGVFISGLIPAGAARAGTISFNFDLSTPTVTATEATFDVSLLFEGNIGDQIEGYQLSVFGSNNPLLTVGDTDFSRFSYSAANSPAPLDLWISSGTIGLTGLEAGFPLDPLLGPFITPTSTPLVLGTLFVDLTGIAPGTTLNVTLADGPMGQQTVVVGIFDGILSVVEPGDMLTFSDPDGVTFQTPGGMAPIPEPSSVVIWICLGLVWLGGKRLTFALGRRPRESVLVTNRHRTRVLPG